MKQRNGGVDEERVTGDCKTYDPVCNLVEETTRNNREKLCSLIEDNFEKYRDEPKKQSSREENSCTLSISMALVLVFHSRHFCPGQGPLPHFFIHIHWTTGHSKNNLKPSNFLINEWVKGIMVYRTELRK
ncbi:hypothetical protein BVC80_1833g154 [Macleaya cordata]|uniref:Uncharacterized protein n=1 Tax=Macleaya cordata TaxID=56857 RepID=A0A200R732_MACCD|nr:hypothetical protein BVC80_1833g154 [Macleaya cordata]